MNKVIIINGPSCAGKSTIAKEICNQSGNRLARRKIVASILLATAKELLHNNFNIAIDTSLDGPDSQELANLYLERLKDYNIKFVGIYLPIEERLKRLKTRTDNLFLTEEFIRLQTDQYDVFKSCQNLYDIWFDSSKHSAKEIASKLLELR
jgi:chloramphenicol 3-O-phosphotransferase